MGWVLQSRQLGEDTTTSWCKSIQVAKVWLIHPLLIKEVVLLSVVWGWVGPAMQLQLLGGSLELHQSLKTQASCGSERGSFQGIFREGDTRLEARLKPTQGELSDSDWELINKKTISLHCHLMMKSHQPLNTCTMFQEEVFVRLPSKILLFWQAPLFSESCKSS